MSAGYDDFDDGTFEKEEADTNNDDLSLSYD